MTAPKILLMLALCTSLLAFAAGDAERAPGITTYEAEYSARYSGFPIKAEHSLRRTSGGYELRVEASNFLGKITEQEQFHLDQQGAIMPDGYRHDRSIMRNTRKESMAVDHAGMTIRSSRKGEQTEMEFEAGQLGPLSHQLELARDLQGGVEELSYSVIIRGGIRDYRYQRLGDEDMETALGTLRVVKLERVRDDSDRETILWLAPELNYQPVLLRQIEDGSSYELTLQSFRFTKENS
ncbi:DUF3108 domain-containing protein [Haliea sp. E1-2-M8]|uniref:DUF3108 domain-containing protein n=1 Tax=Haliea sp. E1-2-M8 TaxID=3064706 RepID=UPI00271E13A7|nr:DUF3108 domain-containing protein [Haliea sp. E1-2-M8]MDO8863454.1 DUF3108 domain-containing protein [Haliea sp. E1-2-M8]